MASSSIITTSSSSTTTTTNGAISTATGSPHLKWSSKANSWKVSASRVAQGASREFSHSERSSGTTNPGSSSFFVASEIRTRVILPASAMRGSQPPRKSVSDLTIDKLNYRNLGLQGRQDEISTLQKRLESLLQSDQSQQCCRRQCILISGYSGCGKTALTEILREGLVDANVNSSNTTGSGLYVKGKFDWHLRHIPYAGIATACNEICRHCLQLNSLARLQELRTALHRELGVEQLALLQQMIPALSKLTAVVSLDDSSAHTGLHGASMHHQSRSMHSIISMNHCSTDSLLPITGSNKAKQRKSVAAERRQSHNLNGSNSQEARNRILFLLAKWIRLMAEYFTPLIIVLDDLQWADGSSLDLLEALVLGDRHTTKSRIMVVGTYRSNEVGDTHQLTQTIRNLKQHAAATEKTADDDKDKDDDDASSNLPSSSASASLSVTHLEIGNLDMEAIHSIIGRLLSLDDNKKHQERTMALARLCHKKTHGNALFLLQFMDMLHQRKLLTFNIGTLTWCWDIEEIQRETHVCQNVVDILQSKMKTLLSHSQREILQLAACLGAIFSVGRLQLIWTAIQESHDQQQQPQQPQEDSHESAFVAATEDDGNAQLPQEPKELEDDGNKKHSHHDEQQEPEQGGSHASAAAIEEDAPQPALETWEAEDSNATSHHDEKKEEEEIIETKPEDSHASSASTDEDGTQPLVAQEAIESNSNSNNSHPDEETEEESGQTQHQRHEGHHTIMSEETGDEDDAHHHHDLETLHEGLLVLEKEGYIEAIDSGNSYRWVHDRIQEAAASMSSQEQQQQYKHEMGKILLAKLNREELESAIFVVVELLNSSSGRGNDATTGSTRTLQSVDKDECNCLQLVELNLQAMKRALSFSAYDTMANYAGKAVPLLEYIPNHWSDHYELCLELYSLGALAEGYLGNLETLEAYCQEVIRQDARPLEDKFPVYHALVDSIGNSGDTQRAADIMLDLLKKFKCRFPKRDASLNWLRVRANIARVRANLSENWFDNIPPMQDATRSELMRCLDKLMWMLYPLEDDRLPLVIYRMIRWTIKYGYCDHSPVAIAFMGGQFISKFNDLQSADMCGRLALSLMNKTQSSAAESRTLLIVYEMLRIWRQPVADCVRPVLRTYEKGLNSGDVESAAWAALHYCAYRYFSGMALSGLEGDLQAYSRQMKDLQRMPQHYFISLLWQMVLNLRAPFQSPEHHLLVDGEAINAKEFKEVTEADPWMLAAGNIHFGMLACFLGEHQKLADLTCEVGHDATVILFPGALYGIIDVYMKGVSCFAAARATRKRKYAIQGRKCLAKLKGWFEQGNPNVHHQLELVKAEYEAYRGRPVHAVAHYQSAIRAAARGGFPHDAGLASVRLGEFHLTVRSDHEEAAFRLREAARYYRDWGATALVEMLTDQSSELTPTPGGAEVVLT